MGAAIKAIVDSAIRINRNSLPDKTFERIRQHFAVTNPDYEFRRRTKRTTYGVEEKLYPVEELNGEVRIPRGGIAEVRALLKHDGREIEFIDRRILPEQKLGVKVPSGIGYFYQRQAALDLHAAKQGYAFIPCGGGKTFLGFLSIAEIDTPTIVLVHSEDLLDQWIEESKKLFGVAPLQFKPGGPIKPFMIAMVQGLKDLEPVETEALFSHFGLTILDECHHVPAFSFRRIVGRSPTLYRCGLTATPDREDGLGSLIPTYFGKLIVKKTHAELVQLGVLVVPEVRIVETAFTYNYQGNSDYGPMQESICDDAPRNALIVSHVEREARAGCVCLVLTGRKRHAEMIGAVLNERGISTRVLTGAKSRTHRRSSLEAARRGWEEARVIVATQLADEGLDLPILSRAFLVWPGKAASRTTQRLGRLMRPHPDKGDPILFDFADVRVPHLRRHAFEREKLYREILGTNQSELPFASKG